MGRPQPASERFRRSMTPSIVSRQIGVSGLWVPLVASTDSGESRRRGAGIVLEGSGIGESASLRGHARIFPHSPRALPRVSPPRSTPSAEWALLSSSGAGLPASNDAAGFRAPPRNFFILNFGGSGSGESLSLINVPPIHTVRLSGILRLLRSLRPRYSDNVCPCKQPRNVNRPVRARSSAAL